MFSLNLNVPAVAIPEHQPYEYIPHLGERPTSNETIGLERRIASRIDPAYENGKRTPAEKKRLIALSIAALCAIAAVGAVVAAIMVAPPIAIAAVVLVGVAIGLTIYAFTREDLDSPKRRIEVMNKIAQKSLEQINADHKRDDLVDYALLDRVFPAAAVDPRERAVAYARFQQLSDELGRAKRWAGDAKGEVRATYNSATATFKGWYNDQKTKIEQSRQLRAQNREIHQMQRERDAQAGIKPTAGDRVLHAVGTGVAVMTEVAERQMEQELERLYGAHIMPWDQWQRDEERLIDQSYGQAVGQLEGQFAALKR